jgi:hypothetical protein
MSCEKQKQNGCDNGKGNHKIHIMNEYTKNKQKCQDHKLKGWIYFMQPAFLLS